MKRFLIFLSMFFMLSTAALAADFPDVSEDHPNFNAVTYLADKGIISGYPDGTFGADKTVNRAEAMKMISKAMNVLSSGSYTEKFPDVVQSEWFFPFVMAAESAGIVKGYDDGNFRPGDTVNMAETLKMLLLSSKLNVSGSVTEDVFADVSKDEWYAQYAQYAKEKNIVEADENGDLKAGRKMTRGEFAEVVYRMMIVKNSNGNPYPLYKSWTEYQSENLPFKMSYDDNQWLVSEGTNEVSFFHSDNAFSMPYPGRVYNNSAVVRVVLDKNENSLSANQYFQNLKTAFPEATFQQSNFKGFSTIDVVQGTNMLDRYIYVNGNGILAIYTEYGTGDLSSQLEKVIESMLQSFEYSTASGAVPETPEVSNDQILNDVLSKVLVEGAGMAALNLLPDKLIIETDTIGVGTGPVDYYYCEALDYTFKYERNSDIILASKSGRSSAF